MKQSKWIKLGQTFRWRLELTENRNGFQPHCTFSTSLNFLNGGRDREFGVRKSEESDR